MSGFGKRKQILLKNKTEDEFECNQIKTLKRPTLTSSRLQSGRSKNYSETLNSLKQITEKLESFPSQCWEREVSDAIRIFLDNNRGMLNNEKLSGYKECTLLIVRFGNLLKKQGKELNEQNGALCLGVYKTIMEQLHLLTKDQRNDEFVVQADLAPLIIQLLKILVVSIEQQSKTLEIRKPSFVRKNSLKKVGEGITTLRPSSRGKLSSLSKKDKSTKGGDLPELKQTKDKFSMKKCEQAKEETLENLVLNCCGVVKNLSANKRLRRSLLEESYLRLINRYLGIWTDKNLTSTGNGILVQLTSAYRHLIAEQKSYHFFATANCFETWTRLVELFPTSNDIIFNILRILSKMSAVEQFCKFVNRKKQFLKTLTSFFKLYKAQIHVVIRIAFIFANMTSFLSTIRTELYFDFQAWDDIFACFQHYCNSQLKGTSEIEKMGVSMAAWDYQAMRKESDVQALMKMIRLIANLFTVPEIGNHLYREKPEQYRQLVKQLAKVLEKRGNLEKGSELAACTLSCLTNTLYYDREFLLANAQYKSTKRELIEALVDFVVQIENEEVCCESLRVLSNLTRMKQFLRPILQAKLHEAIIILLDSTSKEIVYYSLGIVINLLPDDEFRCQFTDTLLPLTLSILHHCQQEDLDLLTVGLKALAGLVQNRSQNMEPKQVAEMESCLVAVGSFCDRAVQQQASKKWVQSAQESRNLINVLLNNLPEEKYTCPVRNCGRKFPDECKLQDHIARRHKPL